MGFDYLFAMPSMLSGAARTLDLGSTFDSYNVSSTGDVADAKALFSDWHEVGENLIDACITFSATAPKATQLTLALGEK